MYYAQTTESIVMQPSPDCSRAILAYPYLVQTRQLEGILLIEGIRREKSVFLAENKHVYVHKLSASTTTLGGSRRQRY